MCLIFVGKGRQQKIFNHENFPIYSTTLSTLIDFTMIYNCCLITAIGYICTVEPLYQGDPQEHMKCPDYKSFGARFRGNFGETHL